jgi:hypothetical protein
VQPPRAKTAARLYRQGRFEEAEAEYGLTVAEDRSNAAAVAALAELALLRNRPDESLRLFGEAARLTSAFKRMWPLSSQLATSEAWAHYRADRFPDAAACFRKAAGPFPRGPFADLAALGAHLASFAGSRPYEIDGPHESRAPFVITDPLPVIDVLLCGRERVRAFIDTGGSEFILDRALAKRVDADIVAEMRAEGAGPKGRIGLGRIDSLAVGEVLVRNVPIHTLDMAAFADVFHGLEVHGIVGTRLLMHFLATIDYVQGALVLRRRTRSSGGSPARILGPHATVIPLWVGQSHYMLAPGTVNDAGPMLFFVDTGLTGVGFSAPPGTLQQAGMVVDWSAARDGVGGFGKVKTVDFTVDQLALGTGSARVVQRNVPAVASDPPVPILGEQLGFRVDGMVSHQFFRTSAITLDFEDMCLVVEPEAQLQ